MSTGNKSLGANLRQFPGWVWALAVLSFCAASLFQYSYVHVRADMRACLGHPPEPLHRLLSYDANWFFVTHELFSFVTVGVVLGLAAISIVGRDHRPLLRWGAALTALAVIRSLAILAVPICRANVPTGAIVLSEVPLLHIGSFALPWRPFADNDLIISGHVAEFVLLFLIAKQWGRVVRFAIGAFIALQIIGLLITRGHYTIDIVLAFPTAMMCLRLADLALDWARLRIRAAADQRRSSTSTSSPT